MINEELTKQLVEKHKGLTNLIIKKCENIELPKDIPTLNRIALLQALAVKESTYGHNNNPRHEPAYYIGGKYFKVPHVRTLYEKFGKNASCSWGPFQIIFVTAYELGYRGTPKMLESPNLNIQWAIIYINKRIMKFHPTSVEQIFDAYNSGSFKDSFVPKEYINEAMEYYNYFVENPPVIAPPVVETPPVKEEIKIHVSETIIDDIVKEIQDVKKRLNNLEIKLLFLKG